MFRRGGETRIDDIVDEKKKQKTTTNKNKLRLHLKLPLKDRDIIYIAIKGIRKNARSCLRLFLFLKKNTYIFVYKPLDF